MRRREGATSAPFLRLVSRQGRGAIAALIMASVISNVLMLTGPLFMLQVYDRVLPSGSLPTLGTLSVLVAGLFAFYTVIEILRSRVMTRIAAAVDLHLAPRVFANEVETRRTAIGSSLLRDAESVRGFLSGPGPLAVLDLPWTPLYLVLVYLLHPMLGLVALIGLVVVTVLAVAGEFSLRRMTRETSAIQTERDVWARDATRNTDALVAMGIVHHACNRWVDLTRNLSLVQRRSADRAGTYSLSTRGFRLLLQSAVLAMGAYLVLQSELSAGVMIAASVITARTLAPIEQIAGQWRGFTQFRQSARRLGEVSEGAIEPDRVELPIPTSRLDVSGLVVQPPGSQGAVLAGIDFQLTRGQALAIIGPSGAGKTALARALTGVWTPIAGAVRLDGAPLDQYQDRQRRSLIGYLPQQLDLIGGTVAQNIAGFDPAATSELIVDAARVAGAHDFIVSLPDGYETVLTEAGSNLSAGQRQRLGLARALYSDPFVVVMDEPNSHLDHVGETALREAVDACTARGAIVIVVAHRPAILDAVDFVLHIERGRQVNFGPRQVSLADTEVPVLIQESA